MLDLDTANMPWFKHRAAACSDSRPSSGDPADAVLGRAGGQAGGQAGGRACQTLVGVRHTLTAGVKVATGALFINISNHKHTRQRRLTGCLFASWGLLPVRGNVESKR